MKINKSSVLALAAKASLLLLIVGTLQIPIATAHSVDHDGHKTASPVAAHLAHSTIDDSQLSVAELIKNYSLSGDDALIERGWELLSDQLKQPQHRAETLLQAAWLSQAQHDFDAALEYASKLLAMQPNNAQAWLLSSSIHAVQGKVSEARSDCQRIGLTLSPLVTLACSARLAETRADQQLGFERLQKLLALEGLRLDAVLKPWVQSVAADLASKLGHGDAAVMLYIESMSAFPSVQVRAAYADLLLKQGRYQNVVDLIADSETTPALQVRRLMAEHKLGYDIKLESQQIDHLFRGWAAANDFRHAREMAMFYLEVMPDPRFALLLANKNIQIQSELEDQEILKMAKLAAEKTRIQKNDKPASNARS